VLVPNYLTSHTRAEKHLKAAAGGSAIGLDIARGPTEAAAAAALEQDRLQRGYQHPESAAAVSKALAELQSSLASFIGSAQVSVVEILGGVGEGVTVFTRLEAAARDVCACMESDGESLVDTSRCACLFVQRFLPFASLALPFDGDNTARVTIYSFACMPPGMCTLKRPYVMAPSAKQSPRNEPG
jgi:hypothetical protein